MKKQNKLNALLDVFTNSVYRMLACGFFGSLFTQYSRENSVFCNWMRQSRIISLIIRFSKKIENAFSRMSYNLSSKSKRLKIILICAVLACIMLCGAAAIVVSGQALLVPFSVLFGILAFARPEFGIIFAVFMVPFYSVFEQPSLILAEIVIFSFLGYIFGILRKEYIFKLELADAVILLFAEALLTSGIATVGGMWSLSASLLCFSLILGYFTFVNIIRTKELAKRCTDALIASGAITAAYGIFQYIIGRADKAWLDNTYFTSIKGRVVSFFDNPNVLSTYLIIVLPFVLSRVFGAKSRKGKTAYLFLFLIVAACIILTYSRAAWIAMVVISLIYCLVNFKSTLKWCFAAVLALPFLPFVLPSSVKERLLSIGDLAESSNFYRVNMWKGTFDAIQDNLIFGVGFGVEAYEKVYPLYSYIGIETAEHCHNLYLQIMFGMGLLGFAVFFAIVFIFMQKNFEFFKGKSSMKETAAAAFSAVIGVLIVGLFDYPWYNYRIFFLFWMALAISASAIRIGESEGAV